MTNNQDSLPPESGTYLHGNALVLMRAIWLALVALMIGTFIVAIPARFNQLQTVTPTGDTGLVLLAPNEAAFLEQQGISISLYAWYFITAETFFALVFTVLGFVIFFRKSTEFLGAFASIALISFGVFVTPIPRVLDSPTLVWEPLVHIIQNIGWISFTVCFYLFPDGRFVPRVTRLMLIPFIGWASAWLIFPVANPFNWNLALALLAMLGLFATGAFAQIYRYFFVSTRLQRLQTRWVVFAFILATAGIVVFLAPLVLVPATQTPGKERVIYHMLGIPFFSLTLQLIPFSIVIAILRYRLWDIDILVRRTLIYSIITAMLALFYFGAVIALQQVFRALTGAGDDLAIIVSTLALAALFNPLRRRVQNAIDHRFYRRKYDAQKILAEFAATARDETDLQKLSERLLQVVDESMQPTHVSLWLRAPPKHEDRLK